MKQVGQILLVVFLCSFSTVNILEPTKILSSEAEISFTTVNDFAEETYTQLGEKDLFFKPYKLALNGYFAMLNSNKLRNKDYITIVDMTKSCNELRMFVIETKTWKVVHKSLVAHGMKTGEEYAQDFSNVESSHQSSLGFYRTGEVYNGKHDMSVKLDGLEPFNDKARERGVVIHAADYVSHEYIKSNGRLGRSYGCPAIPRQGYEGIVDKIKEGSCFFIYYPNKEYLKKSKYVNAKIDKPINCDGELLSTN